MIPSAQSEIHAAYEAVERKSTIHDSIAQHIQHPITLGAGGSHWAHNRVRACHDRRVAGSFFLVTNSAHWNRTNVRFPRLTLPFTATGLYVAALCPVRDSSSRAYAKGRCRECTGVVSNISPRRRSRRLWGAIFAGGLTWSVLHGFIYAISFLIFAALGKQQWLRGDLPSALDITGNMLLVFEIAVAVYVGRIVYRKRLLD